MSKNTSPTNTVTFKSWDEFEQKHLTCFPIDKDASHYSTLLYRGQKHASWKLASSLSRYLNSDEVLAEKYDEIIDANKPKINSMLDMDFEQWRTRNTIKYKIDEIDDLMAFAGHDIEFKTYLRHYGFPSPLLDWTRSLYIAAYFAFFEKHEEDHAAIFCFREYNGAGKSWSSESNLLWPIGPYINTDKRHFIQQAEYTLSFGMNSEKRLVYKNYDWLLNDQFNQQAQGMIYKFLIPSSERNKVLKKLYEYNITSFSLMQTTESLFASIAFEEFVLNKRL